MYRIKPQPVTYRGVTYRSTTEGSWAAFFDVMGIDYNYEEEWYRTKFGGYMPDFYLPYIDLYVEIKREFPDWMTIRETDKLMDLCQKLSKRGIVLFGRPKPGQMAFLIDGDGEGSFHSISEVNVLGGSLTFLRGDGRNKYIFFVAQVPKSYRRKALKFAFKSIFRGRNVDVRKVLEAVYPADATKARNVNLLIPLKHRSGEVEMFIQRSTEDWAAVPRYGEEFLDYYDKAFDIDRYISWYPEDYAAAIAALRWNPPKLN